MTKTFRWITSLIEVVLLLGALYVSVQSAKPFSWPFSWDALRDIGIAQTIYDGQFFQDPVLEGEINWYNPLTGIIVAVAGKVFHLPLPEVYVRIGPFVALLLPISLALFAYQIGGLMASLATLCYCIFARHPTLIEWIYGCYLPWLYASHLGKAFFFFYLTSLLIYRRNPKPIWLYLSGIALGLAFLSHTSAFIEGILIGIFLALWENRAEIKAFAVNKILHHSRYIILIITIALIVSSIYWLPILIKYQFIIKNPYPSLYVPTALERNNILSTLIKSANSFTVIGFICLIVFLPKLTHTNLHILRLWTSAILLVLIYQCFCLTLNRYGYIIPAPYPLHHSFVSFHLLIACFFGYGISKLTEWIADRVSINSKTPSLKYDFFTLLSTVIISVICVLVNAYLYSTTGPPPFSELNRGKPENKLVEETQKYDGAYHWLLQNTLPNDKILCNEFLGVRIPLPAGRKVVYLLMFYLNPYVELHTHINEYNNIWKALADERYSDFFALLKKENIKYIITHNTDPEFPLLSKISKLKVVYSDQLITIFHSTNTTSHPL